MSFIDNIEIKNFKSIRHQKIEGCKQINVFVGPPNVGKSNILEAVGLYSVTQQINGERFPFNSICRYNHFSDLYFDKDLQKKVEIILNHNFTLSFRNRNSYSEFEIYISALKEIEYVFNTVIGERSNFKINSIPTEEFIGSTMCKIKYYHFENNISEYKQKSTSLSIPNGDNLLDILHGNRTLTSIYSEILNSYNLKLNISDNQINVSKELSDGTLVSFQINVVSDTLRRLFFYKTAIQSNSNSVLLFEEPEAHCYEPYILEITNAIKNDKNNNQFFIVTHSQYVVDELLRDEESRNDTNIYLVGLENNETKVKLLNPEVSKDVYQTGLNIFFNYQSLWDEN